MMGPIGEAKRARPSKTHPSETDDAALFQRKNCNASNDCEAVIDTSDKRLFAVFPPDEFDPAKSAHPSRLHTSEPTRPVGNGFHLPATGSDCEDLKDPAAEDSHSTSMTNAEKPDLPS